MKLGLEDCKICIFHIQHIQTGLIEKKYIDITVDFMLGEIIDDDFCIHSKMARSEYQKDKLKAHIDVKNGLTTYHMTFAQIGW